MDSRSERLAEQPVVGDPGAGGRIDQPQARVGSVVAGGGVGLQVGLQPSPDAGGESGLQVAGAITAVPQPQAGLAFGALQLLLETLPLLVLEHLGFDEFEDPVTQPLQHLGAVLGAVADQDLLGPGGELGAHVSAEPVEGPDDHRRLGQVHGAVGQAGGQHRPAGQRSRQVLGAGALGPVPATPGGQPVRQGPRAVDLGHVIGFRGHPQLERGHLVTELVQGEQRLTALVGGHEAGIDGGDRLQGLVDLIGTGQHRMSADCVDHARLPIDDHHSRT